MSRFVIYFFGRGKPLPYGYIFNFADIFYVGASIARPQKIEPRLNEPFSFYSFSNKSFSSAYATPPSSHLVVTKSATSFISSVALPIATPMPANFIIS